MYYQDRTYKLQHNYNLEKCISDSVLFVIDTPNNLVYQAPVKDYFLNIDFIQKNPLIQFRKIRIIWKEFLII